jgi:hypothetical protein
MHQLQLLRLAGANNPSGYFDEALFGRASSCLGS